jgi:hypothetical protein
MVLVVSLVMPLLILRCKELGGEMGRVREGGEGGEVRAGSAGIAWGVESVCLVVCL